ncbi:MAG: hypothetical protein GX882_06250 [Methanomicrobiales archaeon]|nr:hypothetical protein [Methanomicrobiales archaeon]
MNTMTACRTGLHGSAILRNYHDVDKDRTASLLPITLTEAKIPSDCRRSTRRPMQLIPAIASEHGDRTHPPAGREGCS